MEELNLVISEERMKEIPLDVFYGLTAKKNPGAMVEYVAHFVADENGEYLPPEKAVATVTKGRTLGDLEAIAAQLQEALEREFVPNG